MAVRMVRCAKLGQELPGIDPESPSGARDLKMIRVIAGEDMARRVQESISQQAMEMWKQYMLMVMNEYQLDPQSDECNRILAEHMERFFFGEELKIPNYVPPEQR